MPSAYTSGSGLVVGTHDGNLGALMWNWLTARPQQYKELIDIDASHAAFDSVHVAAQRIPPCKKPSDFGLWCLSRATAAAEEETARYFLWHLFSCVGSGEGADGLSHQVVEAQLGAHPVLLAWWRGSRKARDEAGALLVQAMADDKEVVQQAKDKQDEARRNKQKQWQQYLLQHEADIREEYPPALLDGLAHAYFGLFEQRETPKASLLAFLGRNAWLSSLSRRYGPRQAEAICLTQPMSLVWQQQEKAMTSPCLS